MLADIVRGMNEYYHSGTVSKRNLTCYMFYVVIGILSEVCAGGFLFTFGKI